MALSCRLPHLLAVLLAAPPGVFSQALAQPQTPPAAIESLRVVPLAGNNEVNDVNRGIMAPLVVQVLDQQSRPVEGATVRFHFPLDGPSALFPNDQNAQTVRTNADGQAAATGWRANKSMGEFQVKITATRGSEVGETTLTMTNGTNLTKVEKSERKKRWWTSKWFIIGAIAGAGAVTAVVLTRGGSDTSTVTISPGAPSVGGPQ